MIIPKKYSKFTIPLLTFSPSISLHLFHLSHPVSLCRTPKDGFWGGLHSKDLPVNRTYCGFEKLQEEFNLSNTK